jgi:hypothetical protein
MQDQLGYVSSALSERGNHDGKNIQSVVKIAAEFISSHHMGQIAMSSRHQSHVDLMGATASQTFELLLLQNAQKLRLQDQRQVSNFVEEKSTATSRACCIKK